MNASGRPAVPIREVEDIGTLRALSDPIRLAIMRALMRDDGEAPRVMSVKELAGELGEPPTRLYRHVKQLAAVDLIQVAATRVVSGILEHRYRASQVSLRLSHDLFSASGSRGELTEALAATFDDFRNTFLGHVAAGRIGFDPDPRGGRPELAPVVLALDTTLPAARAAEFRTRLKALLEEYDELSTSGPDPVPVEMLCVFGSPHLPA
jgi:DNA-binding transcriptional ArsR family regulator